MSLDPNPIVILGMFRSGTSSVAAAVAKLGVFLGDEEDFFPPDRNNPSGYFESRELVALNNKILAAYRMAFNSVRPFPVHWLELPQSEILVGEVERRLREMFEEKARWGFKQPMAAPLLPIYQEALTRLGCRPSYVVCVRNPAEVAVSEEKWSYSDANGRFHAPLGELAHGLWLHYTLSALHGCLGQPLTIVLYEDFVQEPGPILESIIRNASLSPTVAQESEAGAVVQPGLRRARDADSLAGLPPILRHVYDLASQASRRPDHLESGGFNQEIEALYAEMIALRALFQEAKPLAGKIYASNSPQSVVAFQPTDGWQTVRIPITGGPNPIGLFLYDLPAVLWVRRAAWVSHGAADLQPGPLGAKGIVGPFQNFSLVPGPPQLAIRTPVPVGQFELEIEVYLETGFYVAVHALGRIARMVR
jgi:hypothetical protein